MAISRAQLAKELEPGLNSLFGLSYDTYSREYEQIFAIEDSQRAFEEEVLVTGFGGAPVKTEGQGVQFDNASESYTARYTHDTIALAFSLTEEAVEDNLYDSLGKRYVKALARSMANTKEVKGADVLNNAFSTSFNGGDGKPLIALDHPLAGGGTAANRATTMADLNETSLEDALIDISTFTDDRGLTISVQATKLVVPPQLVFVADRDPGVHAPGRNGRQRHQRDPQHGRASRWLHCEPLPDGSGCLLPPHHGDGDGRRPEDVPAYCHGNFHGAGLLHREPPLQGPRALQLWLQRLAWHLRLRRRVSTSSRIQRASSGAPFLFVQNGRINGPVIPDEHNARH